MVIANKSFSISNIIWKFLDLIYPPTCCNCGKVGFYLCPDCLSQIRIIHDKVCIYCGELISRTDICLKCKKQKPKYKALRSWGIFKGPLRKVIHSLKYQRNLGLGDYFAHFMSQVLNDQGWIVDIIVPVPLNKERLKERGYNQAEILSKPLAALVNKPYRPKSISRIKNTSTQVGLSLKERRQNVKDAFWADKQEILGKNIFIIDDVATTGSTLDACALALTNAGAKEIYGLTLARAIKDTDDQF
jgi:ComF family protein